MKYFLATALCSLAVCSCSKAPPGNYDLEATSVTYLPKDVHVGDGVVFTTVVKNLGKDTIPGGYYRMDLYVGTERVSFDHSSHTFLGESHSIYTMSPGMSHWTPAKAGTYEYRLVLDEKNQVDETNESNNTITGTIVVTEKP